MPPSPPLPQVAQDAGVDYDINPGTPHHTLPRCFVARSAARCLLLPSPQVAQDAGVDYDEVHLPLLLAAVYGRAHLPKLVVMLRNPIDRLHSAYWQ